MPQYDKIGHIIKGGWRRVLRILIRRKLIDRHTAEKEFRCSLAAPNPAWTPEDDRVMKEIMEIQVKRFNKTGDLDDHGLPVLKRNDVMEMSEVIKSARA